MQSDPFLRSFNIMISYHSFQLLKVIAVDIPTKCHLKLCMAVRVTKLMSLLPGTELSAAEVEAALNATPQCRKSQQKFLHPDSVDTKICKARKGQGGNTAGQHCHIIAQSDIASQVLTSIRQGMQAMKNF